MPPLAPASPATPAAVAPAHSDWEGAIGLSAQYRPEYAGAQRRIVKLTPVFFLRYGRFTITNAGGFVTRRADDVVRGLGVDLLERDRWSVKLSLRVDRGRGEGSSADLRAWVTSAAPCAPGWWPTGGRKAPGGPAFPGAWTRWAVAAATSATSASAGSSGWPRPPSSPPA
jgi:hypothetical protein